MLLDVKLSRPLLFCVIGAAVCTSGIGESSHYLKDEPPRVHPLFQLANRAASPFPTDIFTVLDAAQATGRRVNLPYPDCVARSSSESSSPPSGPMSNFTLVVTLARPASDAGPCGLRTKRCPSRGALER